MAKNKFLLNYYYQQELKRQKSTLNLIASENYPSQKVLFYSGSLLMSKYSEGYPNSRYYQGCKYIDKIENLAIELAQKLFGAEYANVQPHSGAQANQAVYLALLKPGDKILSLNLLSGGHLTHGAKINFSGIFYQVHYYNLNQHTQKLDYQKIKEIAQAVQPKLIIAGYSSYSLKINFAKFREIADQVGAYLLADIAHVAGLVATGLFPNPVPYADVITFTTHKTLRGPRGGAVLAKKDLGKLIDRAVFPGNQGGSNQAIIAAKTQCFREALQPRFKKYQKAVLENAKVMADYFLTKGIKLISNGTETHLLILDTKSSYNLTGKESAEVLEKVGIVCNKQMIPYDTEKPLVSSGIRLGSPALTTRGLKKEEFFEIAKMIDLILRNYKDKKNNKKCEKQKENYPKNGVSKDEKINNGEGSLKLEDFTNLEELHAPDSGLTNLDLSNCPNLTRLNVANNNFTRLTILGMQNCPLHGSLEPLQGINKLQRINISNTDIDSGLEYLPESVEKVYCDSTVYPNPQKLEKRPIDLYFSRYNEGLFTGKYLNAVGLSSWREKIVNGEKVIDYSGFCLYIRNDRHCIAKSFEVKELTTLFMPFLDLEAVVPAMK
ncbi:7660_t:CDS:2, partial [Funneliformis geosporum]